MIGYLPGAMPWELSRKLSDYGVKVMNERADDGCCLDRQLITGASPAAADKLGRLASKRLLREFGLINRLRLGMLKAPESTWVWGCVSPRSESLVTLEVPSSGRTLIAHCSNLKISLLDYLIWLSGKYLQRLVE